MPKLKDLQCMLTMTVHETHNPSSIVIGETGANHSSVTGGGHIQDSTNDLASSWVCQLLHTTCCSRPPYNLLVRHS